MNEPIYAGKLDLNKMDESKLFSGRNGAQYLDIVLIPSKDDKYGNSHMIVQGVSKEDRAAGVRGVILGNARVLAGAAGAKKNPASASRAPINQGNPEPDLSDVPF